MYNNEEVKQIGEHCYKFIPLNHEIIKNIEKAVLPENSNIYIFDIDKTLYPPMDFPKVSSRKTLYLEYLVSIGHNHEEAEKVINEYSTKYGKILKGLLINHDISDELYNTFTSYDPEKYSILTLDSEGVEILKNLDGLKICFTNAGVRHSENILRRLGLISYIDYVFHCDLEFRALIIKPEEDAYRLVENFLGVTNKAKIHFFDDKIENISASIALGWNGYHVNENESYKDILKRIN